VLTSAKLQIWAPLVSYDGDSAILLRVRRYGDYPASCPLAADPAVPD
jgi:hypothetical protein